MKLLYKIGLAVVLFLSPIVLHAGSLDVRLAYVPQLQGVWGTSDIYNATLGFGQFAQIGRKTVLYFEESFLYTLNPSFTSVGFGAGFALELGYKLVGDNSPKKGVEMVLKAGAFTDAYLTFSPLAAVLTYGPSVGLDFNFWLTPGFGMALKLKNGFNLTEYAPLVNPSVGLSMIWRKYDRDEVVFAQQKKKVKTSNLNAGIYQKDGNVMFVYESPRTDITSMAIIGDFNNWEEPGIPLEEDGGVWKIVLKLDEGFYQYKFIINGKEKIIDPQSEGYTPDGAGGKNSFLEVTGE
jgi:hypothetical protein